MKKSNLLFLAIIGTAIVLVAAIPISLTRKLATNDFKGVGGDKQFINAGIKSPNFSQLVIKGIECSIIPGVSTDIEIESSYAGAVTTHMIGDTLIMEGQAADYKPRINLFISKVDGITAHNSVVILKGKLHPDNAPSHQIILYNSSVQTLPVSAETRVLQFLDSVDINGQKNSIVSLTGSVHFNRLRINNIDSVFSDRMVVIRSFETGYNGKSRIASQSRDGKFFIKSED